MRTGDPVGGSSSGRAIVVVYFIILWLLSLMIGLLPLHNLMDRIILVTFGVCIPLIILFGLMYENMISLNLYISNASHYASIMAAVIVPTIFPPIGLACLGYSIGGRIVATIGFFIGSTFGLRTGITLYLTCDIGKIISGQVDCIGTEPTTLLPLSPNSPRSLKSKPQQRQEVKRPISR